MGAAEVGQLGSTCTTADSSRESIGLLDAVDNQRLTGRQSARASHCTGRGAP